MAEASLIERSPEWAAQLRAPARIRIVTAVILLLVYQLISASGLVYQGAMPGLPAIAAAIVNTLADPGFYPHLLRTVQEAVVGMVIGASLGAACGIFFGTSKFAAEVFDPWVRALAPAPKIVFLPVLMLSFGIDAGSKTAMAAISAFFPVVVATFGGMRQVRPILVRAIRAYNASNAQVIRMVYLPSILAPLMGSLRLAVGVALIGALLAEVKMSNMGLGYLIIQDFNAFRTADMYALLILVFALALLANTGLRALGARFGAR